MSGEVVVGLSHRNKVLSGVSVSAPYTRHALGFCPPPGRALHELVQLLDKFCVTAPGALPPAFELRTDPCTDFLPMA